MEYPIELNDIPLDIRDFLGRIRKIQFPRQGYTSDVGIIETTRGIFILKRTKGTQFCSWLADEVRVLSCLKQKTRLLVPQVYIFIEENDQSWALLEFFEGKTLRDALTSETPLSKKYELLFQFGKELSRIHSTPCPDELLIDSNWIEHMLLKAEFNLTNFQVDGTKELLSQLKQNKPPLYKQTLIHGDFTIDNIMFHNGELTGIIDWSGGNYGDPRYDVSLAIRPKPNIFETRKDQQIFFEGYGDKIITKEDYQYFADGLYDFF